MPRDNPAPILLRGGGDLATGVALRLHRAGIRVVIAELPQPLAVRRAVSFAEAVYEGTHTVEGITARRVEHDRILQALRAGEIDFAALRAAKLVPSTAKRAKVVKRGEVSKKFVLKGITAPACDKAAIEAAGGSLAE